MIVSDQALIEALINTGGIYSHAAKKLNISRQAVTERVNNNPELKAIVDDIVEGTLDDAEEVLRDLITGAENETVKFSATKFYLSTKGKKRGYIEKSEIDHTTGGEKINIPPIIWANGNTGGQDQ